LGVSEGRAIRLDFMACPRTAAAVALFGVAALSAIATGCGTRAISGQADAGGSEARAADPSASDADAPDASGAAGSGAAELLFPPAAAAGLAYRPCGAMSPLPDLLGIDADGDLVLLAVGFGGTSSLHVFSRRTGRVTRTIELDTPSAMLTGDRLHVLTPTARVDLRTGTVVMRVPPAQMNDVVLAVSPAGDFVIQWVKDPVLDTEWHLALTNIADRNGRDLPPLVPDDILVAAAVTDDAQRALFLVYNAGHFRVEVRRLPDGTLERTIPVSGGLPVPRGGELTPGLGPLLTTSGDLFLANIVTLGYRAFRISDGAQIWTAYAGARDAQLSPASGVVAFRAADDHPWQKVDIVAGHALGAFPPSDRLATRDPPALEQRPLLAFTPDGDEVVFKSEGALRIGRADGSTTVLPFVGGRNAWPGRSAFLSATEVLTVEITQGDLRVGARKRAVPGGEILAEMSSGEPQSEWDGDVAVSPDGKTIAVALPEQVHVVRASDLALVGLIPRAAGRVAWSRDGASILTTTDLHYRDLGRAPPEARAAVHVWSADGQRQRTYELPFVPVFATFTADGREIVATGRAATTPTVTGSYAQLMLSGPLQAARIDRVTGHTVSEAATIAAVDPGLRFATDLRSITRLADGATTAALDLPAANAGGSDADDPAVAGEIRAHHRPAFTPDAALVVDVAIPNIEFPQLVFYEAATGRRVQSMSLFAEGEYSGRIVTLAFSPDGRRLASQFWGGSGTLHLACATP
jgi:hypothetical protein